MPGFQFFCKFRGGPANLNNPLSGFSAGSSCFWLQVFNELN